MAEKAIASLWFDTEAEQAARFYADHVPDCTMGAVTKAAADYPGGGRGDTLTVGMTLMGIECVLVNGGPVFPQSEAFSFQIITDDQAETDRLWHAFVNSGGQESQCGWCKDRWGVSWQMTPRSLLDGLTDPDPAVAHRVMQAMLTMTKIDIAAIESARHG